MKKCTKCLLDKDLSEFYKRTRKGKEVYNSECKECTKQERARYRADNHEKVKDQRRKEYHKHKDKYASNAKVWYELNKEQILVDRAAYRSNNKDKIALWRKRYYELNHESIKSASATYRMNNPDKVKEFVKARKMTPVGRAEIAMNRSKRRKAISFADEKTKAKIAQIRSGITNCHWCNKSINGYDGNECHIDHVIPLSKGGIHTAENIVASCKSCNLKKGNKMPEEFTKVI